MLIRTPTDLGAVIRDRRKQRGLGQAELANHIGVSRQWLIGVEKGRSRAELGLILRTLNALDLRIDTNEARTPSRPDSPNIDAIVSNAKKSKK